MRRWIVAALIVAAFVVPTPARAGLVPIQVSVIPESGMYRFTYAIVLPTDAVLRPGDYFTIYNFDGYVPGTEMASGSIYSADWTFSSSGVGPTPPGVLPEDDPAIPNLSWTYTGAEINLDSSLGSVGLGNFWALSIYPDTTQSWFTASTGSVSGVTDSNITPTTVPVPTAPPPAVPEPGTLVLAGLGLPLAVAFGRYGWGGRSRQSRD
jgi:hypothetical protein